MHLMGCMDINWQKDINARKLTKDPEYHLKSKNIDTKYNFTRDMSAQGM